jgi:hypothetical protein
MTDQTFFISRDVLHSVFQDPRVVRQFEDMQSRVADTSESTTANVADTEAIKDAAFVTLSANTGLSNERVLAVGAGLSLDTSDAGFVKLSTTVAATSGHDVQFSTIGPTVLALPATGIVATRENAETLKNKTLDAPKVSGLGDYADDTAASAGGVPVGGVYRNGSVVQVRVA